MQSARATVIIETVGYVCMLLHFNQCNACTNCMDSSCGNIEEVTSLNRLPVHQMLDLSGFACRTQFSGIQRLRRPNPQHCAWFGLHNEPAFFLARCLPPCLCLRIVGMHLDR